MYIKAEDLGYDRWPEVLTSAGIPDSHFSGRNGPCPICGGNDRYRWSKKHGGVWVCSNCTGSSYASPIKLLMLHMGYTEFRAAADHVREHFNEPSNSKSVIRHHTVGHAQDDQNRLQRNLEKMTSLWNDGVAVSVDDPVDRYLQNRVPGIQVTSQNIRFHRRLPYWAPPAVEGGRPVLLGYYPAMLARAQAANGDFVQLHKTYLTPDGRKADVPLAKKTESGVGANAFAVRLFDVTGDTLGVSEGLETGLAGVMMRNIPVWPCLNGPSMARFELPPEYIGQVRRLIIFADHDQAKLKRGNNLKKPGLVYAEELASRARAMGLRPLVIMPAKVDSDMSDLWLEKIA